MKKAITENLAQNDTTILFTSDEEVKKLIGGTPRKQTSKDQDVVLINEKTVLTSQTQEKLADSTDFYRMERPLTSVIGI